MKFLIVKPSPLPILIPLGPKYSDKRPTGKKTTCEWDGGGKIVKIIIIPKFIIIMDLHLFV